MLNLIAFISEIRSQKICLFFISETRQKGVKNVICHTLATLFLQNGASQEKCILPRLTYAGRMLSQDAKCFMFACDNLFLALPNWLSLRHKSEFELQRESCYGEDM